MLVAGDVLRLALHGHEEAGAVAIRREELAIVPDDERAAGRQLLVGRDDFRDPILWRTQRLKGLLRVTVIPPELERRHVPARGEVEADARGRGERLRKGPGSNFALDDVGVAQVERPEGHVDGVAGHVAQRAGAEVVPAAPFEDVIDILLEWPLGRGPSHRSQSSSAGIGSLPLGRSRP